MAFNPNDYPEEYNRIKFASNLYYEGMLDTRDMIEYYKAKASMFQQKFYSTTADHRKEKVYMIKWVRANREAQLLEESLDL